MDYVDVATRLNRGVTTTHATNNKKAAQLERLFKFLRSSAKVAAETDILVVRPSVARQKTDIFQLADCQFA